VTAHTTTIILLKGCGNHSNRLFQAIHVEAFALEYGLRFRNSGFYDMAPLYHCDTGRFDRLFRAGARGLELVKKIIPFNDHLILHCDDPRACESYAQQLRAAATAGKRYLLLDGWHLRVPELTRKYHDTLVKKYTIRDELLPREPLFGTWSQDKKYVAVHIRRGDYRNFLGGQYFYDWAVYRQAMTAIEKNIREAFHCPTAFLIFSDEPAEVMKAENVTISHYPWYLDHVLMSRCDYIFGPPSTFSAWASYVGKTSYYHLENRDDITMSLERFRHCDG